MDGDTVSVRLTLATPCEDIGSATDMPEANDNMLHIYPNPGSGIFSIECADLAGESSVDLHTYNLLGEIIYSESIERFHTVYELDLSGERPGIYYIHLRKDESVFRGKIVIY
jgi:hypothetical protein